MLASIEAFLHSSCNGGNNGNSVTRYPIFGSNNENMPTNDGQRGLLIDRNIARLKERVIGRGCSAKLCRSARCLGPLMELELAWRISSCRGERIYTYVSNIKHNAGVGMETDGDG